MAPDGFDLQGRPDPSGDTNRHEVRDWTFKSTSLTLAAIVGLVLASLGAAALLHRPHTGPSAVTRLSPEEARRALPPLPRLQPHPATDLIRLRRKEIDWLSTYGWIDRAHGVVHVPIERAMDLYLASSPPARAGGTPPKPDAWLQSLRLDESYGGPEPAGGSQ